LKRNFEELEEREELEVGNIGIRRKAESRCSRRDELSLIREG
jgi:hypothetical protein